jgi:cytochrome d ubiquinol oxidase subunit I
MESVWETRTNAGMSLLLLPDPSGERNAIEALTIPGMLSFLAHHDTTAEIKGLKDYPKELRPSVIPVFLSFRGMAAIGTFMILASLAGIFLSRRDKFEDNKLFLNIMLFAIPLPYLAQQMGWVVAELGRQPWLIYGVFKTSEGVSQSVTATQVLLSLIGFTILYGVLGAIDIYLLAKYAKKGPDSDLSNIINVQGRG